MPFAARMFEGGMPKTYGKPQVLEGVDGFQHGDWIGDPLVPSRGMPKWSFRVLQTSQQPDISISRHMQWYFPILYNCNHSNIPNIQYRDVANIPTSKHRSYSVIEPFKYTNICNIPICQDAEFTNIPIPRYVNVPMIQMTIYCNSTILTDLEMLILQYSNIVLPTTSQSSSMANIHVPQYYNNSNIQTFAYCEHADIQLLCSCTYSNIRSIPISRYRKRSNTLAL